MGLFLTEDDVAELTGIKRGRDGKTRYQMQIEQLRLMQVAFRVNAAGRPIVAVAAIEGKKSPPPPPEPTWQSNVLKH